MREMAVLLYCIAARDGDPHWPGYWHVAWGGPTSPTMMAAGWNGQHCTPQPQNIPLSADQACGRVAQLGLGLNLSRPRFVPRVKRSKRLSQGGGQGP